MCFREKEGDNALKLGSTQRNFQSVQINVKDVFHLIISLKNKEKLTIIVGFITYVKKKHDNSKKSRKEEMEIYCLKILTL